MAAVAPAFEPPLEEHETEDDDYDEDGETEEDEVVAPF